MAGTPKRGLKSRARDFAELHRRVHCVVNQTDYDNLLDAVQVPRHPFVVSFLNAHAANLAWNQHSVVESFARSDLLLRDGIGVELGLRAFGYPHGLNMNGTDLIPKIARAYSGRRTALFGTSSPWLDSARNRLEQDGLMVVACHDGFSSDQTYVDLATETEPDLVVLAMGMPKQEQIAARLRAELFHPVLILNGGAILDFLGDKVTRAPRLMRATGTEWVYRLYLEPRRLARRYLLGIPVYFLRILMTRLMVPRSAHLTADVTP